MIQQVHHIRAIHGFELYKSNKAFYDICNTGNFLFVNRDEPKTDEWWGYYVINHPKYVICEDMKSPRLTEYAKNNLAECCLIFEAEIDD